VTFREEPPPDPEDELSPWLQRLAGAAADPGHWYRLEGDWHHRIPGALKSADLGKRPYPLLPPGRWEFKSKPVPGLPDRVHIWARCTL
jgi:hypothetical protein